VQARKVAGGSYHHFGLIEGIKNVLNELELHETIIKLQVNIDGLPLFRIVLANIRLDCKFCCASHL